MLKRFWRWLRAADGSGWESSSAWVPSPAPMSPDPLPAPRAFDRSLLPPPGGVQAALQRARSSAAVPLAVIVADLDVPGSVHASLATFAGGARSGSGVFDFDLDAEMPFIRLVLLGGDYGGDRA